MSPIPSVVVANRETEAALREARADVSRKECELKFANQDLRWAEKSYARECDKNSDKPLNKRPAPFWEAAKRYVTALAKAAEADNAYRDARGKFAFAERTAAARTAAFATDRRHRSLGAAAIRCA